MSLGDFLKPTQIFHSKARSKYSTCILVHTRPLLMHLLLVACITNHCNDMIRQDTMCNADMTMITWTRFKISNTISHTLTSTLATDAAGLLSTLFILINSRSLASKIQLTSPHPSIWWTIMHRKYCAAYSLCTYIHKYLARTAIIKSTVASIYCKYINDIGINEQSKLRFLSTSMAQASSTSKSKTK
jgi:hypothetical protein